MRALRWTFLGLMMTMAWGLIAAPQVMRQTAPQPTSRLSHRRSPYVGAIAADCQTGRILFADHETAEAYPASVSKLMTLLLVLEDVRAKRYKFSDEVVATADAYCSEPSWVGIKAGKSMTVEDLCYALMIESANDAAIVLGVHSAGSFEAFVARMNKRATQLGMNATHYYNPNGLPPNATRRYPWKKFNVSTAADQLKLALALLKMPEVTRFTSVKTATLIKTPKGKRVAIMRRVNEPEKPVTLGPNEVVDKILRNHNHLMVQDKYKIFNPDGKEAVDGLKTGYIDAGGSSIILTGTRNQHRVVVVVLGSSSSKERDSEAGRLFSDALDAVGW